MGVLVRVRAGGQEIERGLAMTRQERSAVRAQRSRIDQRCGYDRPGLRAERYVHDRRATYILATLHDGDLGAVRLGRARSIFVGLIQVIADRARPLGVRAGLAMITRLLRALQGLGVRPHEIAPSIEQAISMYQTDTARTRLSGVCRHPRREGVDDMLAAAPTLVDLARNPERVVDLPPSAVPSLMAQAAALQAALAARLVGISIAADESGYARSPEAEHLLSPPEAAALLGVTVTWLYRHAGRLPFTRRLSRKALRFSEPGLRRWLTAREP